MKKTISILVRIVSILIFFIIIISCSLYKDFSYDYNELLENVQVINIVDVDRDGYDGELNISILEENDYNDFLLSLSNITYESGILMHPHNVTGVSIMLIYDITNHNYDLVGTRAIEKFENNIKTIHMNMRCSNLDKFNNLINKYYTND